MGLRFGYIVETSFTTIDRLTDKPWPKDGNIRQYLIGSDDASVGHVRFAFQCEHDELQTFQRQLSIMHRSAMAAVGR